MTMSTYITSGQWIVNQLIHPPTVYVIDKMGMPRTICTMSLDESPLMVKANGDMIAAAPEMYEVINQFLRYLKETDEVVHQKMADDLIINALHALAKAEGHGQ